MAEVESSKRTYADTKKAIQRLKAQQLSVKKAQAEIEQNYENVYKEKRESLLSLKHNIRQALLRNLNPEKKGASAGSAYSTRSRQRQMYLESTMTTQVSHEQVMKYLVQYREALKERESKSTKAAQYLRLAQRHTASALSLDSTSNESAMKKKQQGVFSVSTRKRGGASDAKKNQPNSLLIPRKYAKAFWFVASIGGKEKGVHPAEASAAAAMEEAEALKLAELDAKRMKAMKILNKSSRVTPWAVDPYSFTHPQIVCGKKYTGKSTFSSNPRCVIFRDFELDQTYEKTVVLTNISWTITRFKRVEVDDALDDIISVSCEFPGLMSAGMTCDLVVTFQPKQLQDLKGSITILAETGPVSIPIECTTKKAETSVSSEEITLTPVMIGEASTSQMSISNLGAIPVTWNLTVQEIASVEEETGEETIMYSGQAPSDEAEDILSDLGLSFQNIGKIAEYSRGKNKFVFSPVKDIKFVVRLEYVFKTKTEEDMAPIPLTITAQAEKLPLAATDNVVDFKCCKYKSIYRNTMKVHNSGRTALKCCIVQRPELKPYIEFLPDIGYCQAGRGFTFTISFNPTEEIEKDCERWIDKEKSILEVPFKIHAPAQPTPVEFTLRAKLTSSDLIFEPEILDFGKCVADMPTGLKLRVTNKGTLPAKLGMRASKFGKEGSYALSNGSDKASKQATVSFEPNDGFNTILPNGAVDLTVCFCGSAEAAHTFNIFCFALGETGQPCKFSIPCKAEVVHIPFKFSTFHLSLPPTVYKPGSISQASVILRNASGLSACDYQFKSPSPDVTFSPLVGSIPPKRTCRVLVKFEPCQLESKKTDAGSEPAEGEAGEAEAEAGAVSVAETKATPPEDIINKLRSLWAPCVVKHEGTLSLVHLNIQTYVVRPNLKLFAPGMKKRESGICELSFGTVAIGERHIVALRLSADDVSDPVPVALTLLDHRGDFQILNTVRPVRANADCVLHLCFAPRETREYFEKLTLSTRFESIRINLVGEGVLPSMSLVEDQSPIDMGFVTANDIRESTFALKYVSKCPVRYQLRVEEENFSSSFGPSVFSCHPSSGIVESEGELEVSVKFKPRFVHASFMNARVVVKSQDDELGSVNVEGRCLAAGIHLQYPQGKRGAPEDDFERSLKSCIAADEDGEGNRDGLREGESPDTFCLKFDESVNIGESREEVFEIVNTGKVAGDFSFDASSGDIVQERWQISPSKGQVQPGTAAKITATLTMPEDISPEFVAYFGLESWIEGQWKCSITAGQTTTILPFVCSCLVKPKPPPAPEEEAPPPSSSS